MPDKKRVSAMDAAATRLRGIVSDKAEGAFLGDEVELQQTLGISRTTLRQVARLLEREGVLTVKRGANGGYFASRPSFASIEAALTAYLEILNVRREELIAVASITWAETIRQAAEVRNEMSLKIAKSLTKLVKSVKDDTPFRDLIQAEQRVRADIFKLTESPYMKLLFQVNIEFARKQFEGPGQIPVEGENHAEFVSAWRTAKLLELEAISLGDTELGVLAAERTRRLWVSMDPPERKPCGS